MKFSRAHSNVYRGFLAVVLLITINGYAAHPTTNADQNITTHLLLPVGLLNFDAYINGDLVYVTWKTAAETNNDYFTIEKSTDQKNWELVEIVKGAGNSLTLLTYNTVDEKPINGTSFYRLKQTDYDGAYTHSKVKEISFDISENMPVEVFPNPATDHIYLVGSPSELEKIKLINTYGQDITDFVEIIENNKTKRTIDLSNLTAGKYYIETRNTSRELFIL